jgi:hypothetical protein
MLVTRCHRNPPMHSLSGNVTAPDHLTECRHHPETLWNTVAARWDIRLLKLPWKTPLKIRSVLLVLLRRSR